MMMAVENGRGRDLLELDRTAGGHHRRREQRDDVPGSGCHGADRDHCARAGATGGSSGAGHGAGASGCAATTRAAYPEQLGDDSDRPERRQQGGKLAADAANLGAKTPAVGAVAHVAAGQATCPDPTIMGDDHVLANQRARGVTGHARLSQADPRPHQQ